jgi:hypothetical protein
LHDTSHSVICWAGFDNDPHSPCPGGVWRERRCNAVAPPVRRPPRNAPGRGRIRGLLTMNAYKCAPIPAASPSHSPANVLSRSVTLSWLNCELNMNDPYFFCLECKTFVPAGHRWAHLQLEIRRRAKREEIVDVAGVLSAESYWSTRDPKLVAILSDVRAFLLRHRSHRVQYGQFDFLYRHGGEDWTGWLSGSSAQDELLPRYFIEREHCRSWDAMAARIESMIEPPWWWTEPTSRAHAHDRFGDLLRKSSQTS